ncbi:tetraspanin Pls1 family [Hymenopellis radicata]|nr:tetraspanin Pls1 family [Hymenopellis radicata]
MVSRKLMGCFAFVDLCLVAAGAVAVAFSIIWRAPNILMNMVLSSADLTAGLVLGIALLATFVVSIIAVVQRNHVTIGFVILNYCLILDGLIVIVIGTFVWYFTLQERVNFHKVWADQPTQTRITLQDQFKCCGYFDATDLVEIAGTFCNQTQVDFLRTLDAADDNNSHFFCVKPITAFADMTLNNVFTSVYGFMAIIISLILASSCVVNKRKEDERFKKIDAKRGGKGFV